MVDSPGFTSYSVDNDRAFRNALDNAGRQVRDLTIPLTLITRDFFRSQRAIWNLQSPGQYPDVKPATKRYKLLHGMPVYPILKRTGALERSMTDPNDPNAVAVITGGTGLVLGTKIGYGLYHQSDEPRKKIPLRKFLFIGPEAPRFANSDQIGRLDRWRNILQGFVTEKLRSVAPAGGVA